MKRKPTLIYLNIFIALLLFVAMSSAGDSNETQQENHPPAVKIISPKNNTTFDWDTQVNYSLSVSDKEDGDSKFDEINAKEVLLEVRYFSNKGKLPADLTKIQPDPPAIAIMRTSNCFNCHNFNGKSLGPSYYEISKKYPATKVNTDSLVKHIRGGSSGTWGKEKMPTHPELSLDEIKTTVQWILKSSTNPDVNYFIGLEGVFRTRQAPPANSKGFYLLTASYTDHGLKNAPGKQRLKGDDVVVLQGR